VVADVLEVALFEDPQAEALQVWVSRNVDRARHRVPFSDPALIRAEEFVRKVEDTILGNARPQPDEILALGRGLFGVLFRDDALRMYHLLPNGHHATLAIVSSDARILNLPWEYLCDPAHPLGPDITRPVVRVIPTVSHAKLPARGDAPVRVLFVAAEPLDDSSEATDWQGQVDALRNDFEAFAPGDVQLEIVRAATRKMLIDALNKGHWDVVHFAGHGKDGHLVLETDDRKPDGIKANDFALALLGRGIRLVVLTACRSGAGAFEKDFSVVSTSLVKTGIPAVIAMQYSMPVRTATEYVGTFYRQLLKDAAGLDTAVAEGRVALAITIGTEDVQWGIPVLYRALDAQNPFAG
jgi:hypothetical protein